MSAIPVLSSTKAAGVAGADDLDMIAPRKAAGIDALETGTPFAASLDTAAATKATAPEKSISAVYRGSKSGVLTPVQQFESFVLRSFVESMLPQDNTSFFGTGTAGQIWKSMLAERIGEEMAKDGGIGIAELLSKREASAAAAETAKTALAKTDTLSVDIKDVPEAGSL